MEIPLKPCPFCGSEKLRTEVKNNNPSGHAHCYTGSFKAFVRCSECHATGPESSCKAEVGKYTIDKETIQKAAELWNAMNTLMGDLDLPKSTLWDLVEKRDLWIRGDLTEKLEFSTVKLPVCQVCKTEFGRIALDYKYCPECGAKVEGICDNNHIVDRTK